MKTKPQNVLRREVGRSVLAVGMSRSKNSFIAVAMTMVGCATATLQAASIHVFAAASLTDSLKEIAAGYEKQTGDKVVFNFGASSFLGRQIEEGAPADVFFSADEARMNSLEKKGLIVKETRKSRLSNSLVIVVTADSTMTVHSANNLAEARVKRIALADPRTVPAGIYAREYLEKAKLWTAVEPKIIPTDNVRAALAAVESGNVEVGMVYKTDAAISQKVKVAFEVPASESPAISYPMAVLKEARNIEAARRFLKHLDSAEAGRVFEKFGFIVRK
jgi:molybdate transport system substrate-binding protein